MTREEAINVLEDGLWWQELDPDMSEAIMDELDKALDMAISALRAKQERLDKVSQGNSQDKSITNANRIRSMSDEELADFLCSIAYARATPWSEAFMPLCRACKGVECTFEDGHREILHECEFSDGQCPHGHEISWWLKQTAEDEDG